MVENTLVGHFIIFCPIGHFMQIKSHKLYVHVQLNKLCIGCKKYKDSLFVYLRVSSFEYFVYASLSKYLYIVHKKLYNAVHIISYIVFTCFPLYSDIF